MLQNILVALIFSGALFYIGRLLYNNFTNKSDCASGCGKCNTIDFNKIEKQLKEKSFK